MRRDHIRAGQFRTAEAGRRQRGTGTGAVAQGPRTQTSADVVPCQQDGQGRSNRLRELHESAWAE